METTAVDYTMPANLAELTDEELSALSDELDALFDSNMESGTTDVAGMTQLTEDLEQIAAEANARKAKADEDAATLDDLAARRAAARGTAETETVETTEPPAGEPAAAETTEPAAAAASTEPQVARVRTVGARATGAQATETETPAPAQAPITITAAADLGGNWAGGATMSDLVEVARAMKSRARSLQIGGHGMGVATFHLPIPESDFLGDSPAANLAVIDRIGDGAQSVVAAGMAAGPTSLVAAGGFCGPYDIIRDFFTLDHSGGLLDIPNVGVRGGVQVPAFIGLGDASSIGWSWTVANDIAAQSAFAVTTKALTTNVATLTTQAATHAILVGDVIAVALVPADPVFDGTYTVTAVTANTVSYAKTNANVGATATNGAVTNTTNEVRKPCFRIPCPTWSTYELAADGLCLIHGNLLNMQMPELEAKWVRLALDAHLHRISASNIAAILTNANTDAVTVTQITATDAAGELLNAIELQVADFRSQHKLNRNVVLDAGFPDWTINVVRANMAMRNGVDFMNVTDAQVLGWFGSRGIRPQFLADYLPLWTGAGDTPATAWPTTLQFFIYPAGGFVNGDGGTIDLGVIRDSTLNSTNDYTAAFTEEFHVLIRRGPKGRRVTITLDVTGTTGT